MIWLICVEINILIKLALEFISKVDYIITGQFIDLRNGIIYISLIGSQANICERNYFIELDKKFNYRKHLLSILKTKAFEIDILDKVSILEGGNVGIGIHPIEWDKVQVAYYLIEFENSTFNKIIYFGDKYLDDGNDFKLLNHPRIIGHKVDNVENTKNILETIYLNDT